MPTDNFSPDVALKNLYSNPVQTNNSQSLTPSESDPLGILSLVESGAPISIKGQEKFIDYSKYNYNIDRILQPIEFNDIYTYLGPNSGFARKYPNYLAGRDNEAYAANKQSGWEILGNTVGQFGVLAGSTFANHWAGTVSNVGKLMQGDLKNFFDTDMSRFVADVATTAQYEFPIYTTSEMREYDENNKGFIASVGKYVPFIGSGASRNWARLGGQLGFTAGTIGAAAIEEIALAAATSEAGGIGALAAAPRNGYKIFRSFSQVFKNLDKLEDAYKTSNALSKLGSQGFYSLRMANLATGEARMEAVMASEAFKVQQLQAFQEKGILPSQEELSKIQDQSEKVGNTVFNWNLPILMASNLVMLNNIGIPKYLSSGKQASTAAKIVNEAGTWLPEKELKRNVLQKFGYGGMKLLKGVGSTTISEGSEELLQGLGSRAAEQYYNIYRTDIGKSNTNFIGALGSELSRSFSTGEGWDEFVAGAMTGLLTGGIGSTVNYVTSDKNAAANLANEMNTLANDVVQSYNYKNFTEQVEIAGKSAVKLENGDIKGVKDLQNESLVKFFQISRRTGKDKKAIEELMGYLKNVDPNQQDAVNEMLGDQTIEQFQNKLNTEYDRFTKYSDMAETMFRAKEGQDQGVMDFVKTQFVSALMGSADAKNRISSISRDLTALTAQSKNAPKINELTRNLLDSEELSKSIGSVSYSIESLQDYLSNVETTKEDRFAKEQELKDNKKHLENLQSVYDALYGEKTYSPEQAAKRIVDAINNYDPSINKEEVNKLVTDMVALEADNQELVFFANMLQNPKYRETFYQSAKDMADKVSGVKTKETPKTEATPEQETVITPEQAAAVEATLEESGIDQETQDNVVSRLQEIQKTDGKYSYDGATYDTIEQAQEAVFNSLDQVTRNEVIPAKEALVQKALQKTPQTITEPVTQTEYENWKNGNLPQSVIDKLISIKGTPTNQEQEMLDSLKEEQTKESLKESEEKTLLPRTTADVLKDAITFKVNPVKGILSNYYNLVVGRVYPSAAKANKELQNSELTEALKGIKNPRVTTINLNDNVIKENVNLVKDITTAKLKEDIEARGYSVVKDPKGRLIVITQGSTAQARETIASGLNLYLNPEADNGYVVVREGGAKGKLIASTFGDRIFGPNSTKKINDLRKGDRIQIVVPSNQFNQDLLEKFNKIDSTDKEALDKGFKTLQDNLVLELRTDNVAVGVMRAGDYFAQDTTMSKKVKAFRANVIKSNVLGLINGNEVTLGTVAVSKIVATHNVNIGTDGNMVFTTLQKYEASQKKNKNIKISYFLGSTTETATGKDGETLSRTQLGRSAFFIPNAVYVRIKDLNTGEEVVTQGVTDTALTFSQEEFQNNTFKTQLSINLQPSETPLVSKRVAVDESSFTTDQTETKNKSVLKSEIQQALTENNSLTLDISGLTLPLSNVEYNQDTQVVTGTDPNGNEQSVSIQNITSILTLSPQTGVTEEVELLEELPQIPNEQKQEWVLELGELNKPYILEDNTELTVLKRDNEGTLIVKDGFYIRLDSEGNNVNPDINLLVSKLENEIISDESLYNIWISRKEGLSLENEIILDMNTERTAKFQESMDNVESELRKGYNESTPLGIRRMLESLDNRPEELLLNLALANLDLKTRGVEVTSLRQLMDEAGLSEDMSDAIQDIMSFGSYVYLFNLVTNGVNVKTSESKLQLGQQLMLDFGDITTENAIDVEINQQNEEELPTLASKLASSFKNLLGKQGLFVKGIDDLKNKAADEIGAIATAIKNFTLLPKTSSGYEFLKSYLTLNKALKPYGIEVNLEKLIKVEPTTNLDTNVNFITINDSVNFLKEFDDVQMQQENKKRIEEGKETIFVKRDQGGLFELPVRQIQETEATQNDTVYLNDILQPLGYTVEGIYVAANHIVNGDASSMIERSIRKESTENNAFNEAYVFNGITSPNGSPQETFFNKKKAIQKTIDKTCN